MMIEVNLLPAELRRVEHTPLPRFLVILIGTAAVMATVAFGVIVNLRRVPDLGVRQADLVKEIAVAQTAAAAYDKLQDEISDVTARKHAIAEVWRTRIIWSLKLAQLAQMTPPYVGFTGMKLDEGRSTGNREQENGGMLTLESLLAGSDLNRVADWRRIVEGSIRLTTNLGGPDPGKSFYASFQDLLPTETTKVDVKDDYVEKEALKVALKMPIKGPSTRLDEALQAIQEETKKNAPQTTPATDRPARRPREAKPEPASDVRPSEKSEAPAAPAGGPGTGKRSENASPPKAAVGSESSGIASVSGNR